MCLSPFFLRHNRNRNVSRAPSKDFKVARGSILSPNQILNVIRAHFKDFSNRRGEPWPVFKCKWGLELAEGKAVENVELM